MKSTAKKLAVCAAALCLLACGTAVSAAAASPVSGLALSGVAMPWDQDVPAESIEAGSYTANMLLGSSQQLSPVVRPRNSTDSVVFISDDTSILTVSNSGVVQAVGVGTTRITAAAGNQICAYTIGVSMDSSMIVTEMDLSLSSNTIYFGSGYYGIAEAAEGYFGKEPAQLTDAEAIYLAGMPNAPSTYASSPELAFKRMQVVLKRMVKCRVLTQQQADAIAADAENLTV